MRRLLLLTRHYPPAVSGGIRRPYLLARVLRDLGVEVRVIAPSLPEGEPGLAVPHPNRDPTSDPGAARPSIRSIARDLLLWPDPISAGVSVPRTPAFQTAGSPNGCSPRLLNPFT